MSFENNNTREKIDNESINMEKIGEYLNTLENQSKQFLENREAVLKALNYSEKSLRDKLDSTDIDLEFKDGKYYIISENGLNDMKGYTAKEFIEEYGEKEKSLFEKGEEIYNSIFGGKETLENDSYTIINEGDSNELIIAKNELIDLYNKDYLTREEFLKEEYKLRNLIEKLSKEDPFSSAERFIEPDTEYRRDKLGNYFNSKWEKIEPPIY